MNQISQALWFSSREKAVIQSVSQETRDSSIETEPSCEIETLYSAVSPGTERLVFRGEVPPGRHEDMRCPYMDGSFAFPVKYGYSVTGRVLRGEKLKPGVIVHALHPHQTFFRVRETDVAVLPENLSPRRGVLASNLETAVTAVWDSRVSVGDRVLVVGFGIIGALIARLITEMPGTDLTIVDPSPRKRDLAKGLGMQAVSPAEMDAREADFDLAFHASGSESGLQTALDKVGFEGRVLELSWYGTHSTTLNLGGDFHSARKSIIASQVSTLPAERRSRWDSKRRKGLVLRLLTDPWYEHLITREVAFNQLPDLFDELNERPGRELAIAVNYSGA